MGYYRNPMSELADYLPAPSSSTLGVRLYRQYQEIGLPCRITGFRHTPSGCPVSSGSLDTDRKEVVIENDIGWRINALIDFALPRLPAIASTAATPELRQKITHVLNSVLEASGGITLLQQLALLGSIHGTSYLMLQPSADLLQALARNGAAKIFPMIPNACLVIGEPSLPPTAKEIESPNVSRRGHGPGRHTRDGPDGHCVFTIGRGSRQLAGLGPRVATGDRGCRPGVATHGRGNFSLLPASRACRDFSPHTNPSRCPGARSLHARPRHPLDHGPCVLHHNQY